MSAGNSRLQNLVDMNSMHRSLTRKQNQPCLSRSCTGANAKQARVQLSTRRARPSKIRPAYCASSRMPHPLLSRFRFRPPVQLRPRSTAPWVKQTVLLLKLYAFRMHLSQSNPQFTSLPYTFHWRSSASQLKTRGRCQYPLPCNEIAAQ